jgi:hypothetical protein
MEKFRYTKEWEDRCRQRLERKKTCWKCNYELLCLFQQNQERLWKDIAGQEKTT